MGVQRFLSRQNAIAATITASSVRASTAVERLSVVRDGGGRVRLDGQYIGAESTDIEVEIVSDSGIPRASKPVFSGIGSGNIDISAVTGLSNLQEWTLTLDDLGVDTESAWLDVREVRLVAKASGASGNAVKITVDPQLTKTATSSALLQDWNANEDTKTGSQWDFGGSALNSKGELDANNVRIQFGSDPQVYRPWKEYRDGAWRYGLSPSMQRDIKSGTPVYTVTGGHEVTIEDGSTTETYGSGGSIETFYDLLAALDNSALVEVSGVVSADRTPGGQASVDVPLRTQSWLLDVNGVSIDDVSVPSGAPTQTVTVKCVNNDVAGNERWSVRGDVSGAHSLAETGIPYTSSAINFTIPQIDKEASIGGDWSFKFSPAQRADDEGVPSVCLKPFKFGVNAHAKTITFRYEKRPPSECDCSRLPGPGVSNKCLGLGGDVDIDDINFTSRVAAIYAWRETFIRDNTEIRGSSYIPGTPPTPDVDDWMFAVGFQEQVTHNGMSFTAKVRVVSDYSYTSQGDAQGAAALVAAVGSVSSGVNTGQQIMMGGVPVTVSAITAPNPVTTLPVTVTDANPGTFTMSQNTPGLPGTPGRSVGLAYLAYRRDLDFMEGVIPIMVNALAQVYDDMPALSAWDVLWAEVKSDFGAMSGTKNDIEKDADADTRYYDRYEATIDNILLTIGILPKSSANTDNAGRCWRDYDDSYWWADTEGKYLPAFTNQAYISARRDVDGRPYSTMEFGFGLVVACPDRLKEGDSITIKIDAVDKDMPYRVGDSVTIKTVGAGPAQLSGGITGTDEQIWRVHGSVSGSMPDYAVSTINTPQDYTQDGVTLRIDHGGIPFSLGDQFTFSIEAGEFRWRRDGGSWSAVADIPLGGVAAIADGINAVFEPGAAPSFVPGDTYLFRAHQHWAASHSQDAGPSLWGWSGASATMTLDLGSPQDIEAVALARYDIAGTAAVEFSADGTTWTSSQSLDTSGPVAALIVDENARYVRITVSGSTDGHIGWIYVGKPASTTYSASSCVRRRSWAVSRGQSVNPRSLYAGRGDGWDLEWAFAAANQNSSMLERADVDGLVSLLDFAQREDEPLIFIPHVKFPEEASLVRFAEDALEITDEHSYQWCDRDNRQLQASLRLDPVMQ